MTQDLLSPLKDREGKYTGPDSLEEGIVVRVRNGKVVWPEGFSDGDMALPEGFPDGMESDLFSSRVVIGGKTRNADVVVRQLATDTYCLEWTLEDEENFFLDVNFDLQRNLMAIESVTGGFLYVYRTDDPGTALYDGYGRDESLIREAMDLVRESEDGTGVMGGFRVLQRDLEEEPVSVLFFFPWENSHESDHLQALAAALIIFLILAVIYVWLFSTRDMVLDKILTKPQMTRFHPRAMRRRTLAAGAFCIILLFAAARFIRVVGTLYQESLAGSRTLEILDYSMQFLDEEKEIRREELEWVEYYGNRIAVMLGRYPDEIDHVRLATLNESVGSEYILLFDEKGEETACSGDYLHVALGRKETDPLYTFRRITNGLPSVIGEEGEDLILGKKTYLVGCRMDIPGADGYGVVLISVSADRIHSDSAEYDQLRVMEASIPENTMIFAIDPDRTKVDLSTAHYQTGMDLESVGLEEAELKESALYEADLDGMDLYASSRMIGDRLFICFFEKDIVKATAFPFSLACGLCGLIAFLVLSVYMLHGYTESAFEIQARMGEEAVRGSRVEIITADGRIKQTRDPSRRWSLSFSTWKEMYPEDKTRIAAQVIISVYFALILVSLRTGRGRTSSLFLYLLKEDWTKGFNIFAVCSNFLLIAGSILALLGIRILMQLACSWLSTKGETVLRLLYNLLQYVALLTVIFYCFRNFGIDTSALLTAMGLISLAVSIGARDLVADIIAGITIVFEGSYQVGDIVEIDGYRGKVQEIGIRSTKILGMGDNIKIINNRDVRNVLNTTRFNSWYAMSLNVSSSYDLKKMEDLLERELPRIGERIRQIISGPVYRGIEAIGKDSFRITILAECREEDYRWVQRQLNREIRLLLDREEVPIL